MTKMQNSAFWRIDGEQIRLDCDAWHGLVDLNRPAIGLQLRSRQSHESELQLAGIQNKGLANSEILDQFIRGNDCFVCYQSREKSPTQFQIYWRILDQVPLQLGSPANFLSLEAIVSVQTDLLGYDILFQLESVIPRKQISFLPIRWRDELNPSSPEMQWESGKAESIKQSRELSAADVVLWQSSESQSSLAIALCHSDRHSCERTQLRMKNDRAELSHHFRIEQFEKGVIRRLRMRFLLQPHIPDEAAKIKAWLDDFVSSEIPLTT